MRCRVPALGMAVALGFASTGASAQSFAGAFAHGDVNGELRVYNFNRLYAAPAKSNARALAGALLLNEQTAAFGGGFSLGASLLTANALGTRPGNPAKVDTTLMGPDDALTALGQAYLQYKRGKTLFRIGDQYLDTPWMGKSDSRVLPAAYRAVSVAFTPLAGWDVFGIRSYGWKSRTSGGYRFDNLYYPSTFHGDSMFGGSGGLLASARAARGAWALGTAYGAGGFKGRAWYYDFLGFARMVYADGSYTFKTGGGIDPFVAAQYLSEGSGSGSILVADTVKLFGVAGRKVHSRAWGIDGGIATPHGKFDVSWNRIARNSGAVGGGAVISPYTAGYATDPLYTTSMIRGLVEQGPGHAWKARFTYGFLDDRLLAQVAYAKYATSFRGNSHDVYLDVTYRLDAWLKGLTVRDRWERSSGGMGLNPGNRPFVYNRLMIDYAF